MFLHSTPLPSQPASFVGLCHSLICCIVSSQAVWLSLRNYHSNQLSQVMVSSEFRKSSTAPAVLCWVRRALLPSSLGSGSVVSNKGSRLWLFLTILAGEMYSPLSLYFLRGLLSIFLCVIEVLVAMTKYCLCSPYSRAHSVSAFHSSLVAKNALLFHKLTRITKSSLRTDCSKRFNISLISFYLLVGTEQFGGTKSFSKYCGFFHLLIMVIFSCGILWSHAILLFLLSHSFCVFATFLTSTIVLFPFWMEMLLHGCLFPHLHSWRFSL